MRITVELDLETNQLVVQQADLAILEKNHLIASWSDGTTRLLVNRFVLFVNAPLDEEETA